MPDTSSGDITSSMTNMKKDGVTIEMHRDVLFRLTNAYDYFADIWERAIHAKRETVYI